MAGYRNKITLVEPGSTYYDRYGGERMADKEYHQVFCDRINRVGSEGVDAFQQVATAPSQFNVRYQQQIMNANPTWYLVDGWVTSQTEAGAARFNITSVQRSTSRVRELEILAFGDQTEA